MKPAIIIFSLFAALGAYASHLAYPEDILLAMGVFMSTALICISLSVVIWFLLVTIFVKERN